MQDIIGKGFLSGFYIAKTINEQIYNEILQFDIKRNFLPSSFVVGSFFEESSSRTRFSTEASVQKLGGNVIHFSSLAQTSISKGETFKESAELWSRYFDLLVIRSKNEFLPFIFNKYSSIPVINLGDGTNEHPTQGLATLVHAYKVFGKIGGLNICLWGDFIKSRAMHSVAIVFSLLGANVYIHSIPPIDFANSIIDRIKKIDSLANIKIVDSIECISEKIDIFYLTRLQKERWDVKPTYSIFLPDYCTIMSNDGIILHSLPHGNEISEEIMFHRQSRIYEHIKITQQTRAWLLYSYKKAYDNNEKIKSNIYFYEEVFPDANI